MIRERKTHDKEEKRREEKIKKNPSIKKQEFKGKSIELAVTSAPKSGQINQYSKEKATFAPKSGQTNQYSKEKATFAPKPSHTIKKISRYIPFFIKNSYIYLDFNKFLLKLSKNGIMIEQLVLFSKRRKVDA